MKLLSDRFEIVLKSLLVFASVYYIAFYLLHVWARIRYPFQLEWMEAGMLAHVGRLLAGQPLFVAPSAEFIPHPYAPFYYYVVAFFSFFMELDFVTLRSVSVLSSLLTMALMGWIVGRETKSSFWGLVSAGLYAASYPLCRYWFDLGRVDSLYVLLLIASWGLLKNRSLFSGVITGFLLCLAVATKQQALLAAPVFFVVAFAANARRAWWMLATFLIAVSAYLGWYGLREKEWFWFYVYQLPSHRDWLLERVWTFWNVIIYDMPALIAMIYLWLWRKKSVQARSLFSVSHWYWLLPSLALITISYAAWWHTDSARNTMMPVYATLAIFFGICGSGLVQEFREQPFPRSLVYLIFLSQFLLLIYSAGAAIPAKQHEMRGWLIVEALQKIKGSVLIPGHPNLAIAAGKKQTFADMTLVDLMRSKNQKAAELAASDVTGKIRRQEFAAIVTSVGCSALKKFRELESYYEVSDDFSLLRGFSTPDGHVTETRCGQLDQVYVPRKHAQGDRGGRP